MGNLSRLKRKRKAQTVKVLSNEFFETTIKKLTIPDGLLNRTQEFDLEVGEVIRAQDRVGMFSSGIYKVESIDNNFIQLSAGDHKVGMRSSFIEVLERHLAEPESWERVRDEHAINNPHAATGCPECEKLRDEALARRARRLESEQTVLN